MLKLTRDANPLRLDDYGSFSDLIHEVLGVRRHIDLMHWLQGGLQRYIPHEILIAAWGDFRLGVIHYDVVSAITGVRSENVMAETISPLLIGLFNRWVAQDRRPFSLNVGHDGFAWEGVASQGPIAEAMTGMKSSLVHGIGDQRGRHDCLYVFFSQYPKRRSHETNAIRILLPYIDAALRQVDLMPNQYPGSKQNEVAARVEPESSEGEVLSEREAEIMKWVAMGKTNGEIGSILNVSSFTVKNHMQRIFKKLDVFNRAQAVSTFKSNYAVAVSTKQAKQDA
jgi:transcriptional regulator EpsA